MSKITNDNLTLCGTWMLYSCTHMATVGAKGLSHCWMSLVFPLVSAFWLRPWNYSVFGKWQL